MVVVTESWRPSVFRILLRLCVLLFLLTLLDLPCFVSVPLLSDSVVPDIERTTLGFVAQDLLSFANLLSPSVLAYSGIWHLVDRA